MILFDGKLYSDKEQDMVLDELWEHSVRTVSDRKEVCTMASMVIDACAVLAGRIRSGEYDEILLPLLAKGTFTREQMEEAVSFFERENLSVKYETELGILLKNMTEYVDEQSLPPVRTARKLVPLGILFHIAAGNAQGLPFYSVIEGMIAGNVNILKLPSADDGLSVILLHEIVKINPELAPYVCVLDVPSSNLAVMKRLEWMADAVVVWGGDEAVKAVRTMADTKTQIISWGHKLSFAYVTQDVADEELVLLARHICVTRQLLCNSCQGIFVDTKDEETVLKVGKRFLKILESENAGFPKESIGVRGKVSILLYNEELECIHTGKKILRGDGVSVTVSMDSNPELSFMFKNCWVKPLPRKNIVRALKDKKGHLQTVGLACGEKEREELADLFIKAGATHVTRAGRMAHSTAGAAHDGEYPLRRYTRIAEVE